MINLDLYLKTMIQPNTAIKCSKKGLVLVPEGGPFQTTKNKVERIAEFLSANKDSIQHMDNSQELLDALKEKLVREAEGNPGLIKRVKNIGFKQGESISPTISIVDAKDFVSKPIKVVKFGLILEQSDLLTNDALFIPAENLLKDGIPIIVNRDFLVAHRRGFAGLEVPCTCFHQKEGGFSVILPVNSGSLADFGFNEQEMVQGSFSELPDFKDTQPSKDLDKILLKENEKNKFSRVGHLTGHGLPEFIIGLPISEFQEVQNTLKKKGMKFGIIDTCFGGGGNLKEIQKTPYPVLLNSSSEVSSIARFLNPSQSGILEYACNQLQKNPNSALKLDEATFLEDETVHSILKGYGIKNAPQMIIPTSKPFLITPEAPEHKSFRRLQKAIYEELITLEGKGGLVSPGGTKNHLLNEVKTSSNPYELANETFRLLNLSNSKVEKGFFIKNMGDFKNVVLFASNEMGNNLIFSKEGKFYYYLFNVEKGAEISADVATSMSYTYFAKTLVKKGEKGEALLKEFQKHFFGKEIDSPFHQALTMIVKAYLYPETDQNPDLSLLAKDFSFEQKKMILMIAKDLHLSSLENALEGVFTPKLIQNIKQKEGKTIQWIKSQLEECQDRRSFLNEPDATGKTALFWALQTEQKDLIDFLLAKMTEACQFQESPWCDINVFFEACEKGNQGVLKRLFKLWGVQANQLSPGAIEFALNEALMNKNKETVQYLLQNAEIDVKRSLSNVLNKYVRAGDMEFITFLLENGADPNNLLEDGSIPLGFLCSSSSNQKQMEIFELLIKKGADVNRTDQEGDAPIFKAIASKNLPLIEALIHAGASLNKPQEKSSKTPFGFAMRDEHLMEFILNSCSIEELDKDVLGLNSHPLFLALKVKDIDVADLLEKKGFKFEKLHGNFLLNLYKKGHVRIYQLFLNSMIEQCPEESLKSFYLDLKKGVLKEMSKEDTAKAWDYLPPPLILTSLKNPSEELIQAVIDQMTHVNVKQMTNDELNLVYIHLLPLIEENRSMLLQFVSHLSEEHQERMRVYYKL